MLQQRQSPAVVPEAPPTLRIGQLARLASVHVETLRFYEREGLLEKPYQHLSGYRAYPVGAVAHVQSIKRAQALGFSLAEIRRLLKPACRGGVADEAAKKLAEIDLTLAELQRARAKLLRLIDLRRDRLVGCTCGQADCPTTAEAPATASHAAVDPSLKTAPAKRPGLVAGALLATGCAACCAPIVGAALAAVGAPVLVATVGLELGLGATAIGVGGIALARIRRSARIHPRTTR